LMDEVLVTSERAMGAFLLLEAGVDVRGVRPRGAGGGPRISSSSEGNARR